jgi:arylsulfatase B
VAETPAMDELVRTGIELTRHYVYQFCSPTRCAIQTGRNPLQVNPLNLEPDVANPSDPIGGFAGIARNFTGIAAKLAQAGYRTHFAGKWDAGMVPFTHWAHWSLPACRRSPRVHIYIDAG